MYNEQPLEPLFTIDTWENFLKKADTAFDKQYGFSLCYIMDCTIPQMGNVKAQTVEHKLHTQWIIGCEPDEFLDDLTSDIVQQFAGQVGQVIDPV
jgi:hypothetical protein